MAFRRRFRRRAGFVAINHNCARQFNSRLAFERYCFECARGGEQILWCIVPSFEFFAQKVKRGGSAGRRLPSGDAIGERAHPQNKVAHFAKNRYTQVHKGDAYVS